jgi:uncharacterized protein
VLLGWAVFLCGVFAPSLVAVFLTWRAEGRPGVEALLRPILHWEVAPRFYLFAVGFLPALKLGAALLHRVLLGTWPGFGTLPWYAMAGAILVSTWIQAGEEVGWRGYALPRLAAVMGLGWASVALGVVWAAWHLPHFYFPEGDTFGQSFPVYLLNVTAISVAMAWLFWRTGGSLLLVMVMHAAVNNTKGIVPAAVPGATDAFALSATPVGWIGLGLAWAVAALLLLRMRGAVLPRRPRRDPEALQDEVAGVPGTGRGASRSG